MPKHRDTRRDNSYDIEYMIAKAPDQASRSPEDELRPTNQPCPVVLKVDRSAKVKMTIHVETECLDAG